MDTIQNYKCPCCGAPLVFDAASQNLHCESCENTFPLETMQQMAEGSADSGGASKYDWEHYEPRNFEDTNEVNLANYSCPSCGAEITGDDTLGSTVCPYCGNSTIVKGQFEGTLRPDYIIPFKLNKKMAMAAFEGDFKNAPFLPNSFKNKKKIEEMAGVYVPFWMFDCDCDVAVTSDALVLSVEKENTLLGRKIYCEITDSKGTTVKTDEIKVYGPFSMSVDESLNDDSGKNVLTGRVADGILKKGEKVSVIRNGKVIAIGVAEDLQMFSKSLDETVKGDNVEIVFNRENGVRPKSGDIVVKYQPSHKIDTSDIVN